MADPFKTTLDMHYGMFLAIYSNHLLILLVNPYIEANILMLGIIESQEAEQFYSHWGRYIGTNLGALVFLIMPRQAG